MSDITKPSDSELLKYLNQLCDNSKLERDRGEEKLSQFELSESNYDVIITWVNDKLNNKTFENCLGSLMGCKLFMSKCSNIPFNFLNCLSEQCIQFHYHKDFRVRILAGDCMGLLCKIMGLNQFKKYIDIVKEGIKMSFIDNEEILRVTEESQKEQGFQDNLGWKSLETWMKCFQALINGIGEAFEEIVDMDMLSVVFEATGHKNRFIRETACELLGTVAEYRGCVRDKEIYIGVCSHLRKGLTDNWSQVRMSASIAARKILMTERAPGIEENEVHSIILPGICMNRYYLAEGVRLFNQDTWKMYVGDRGKELIEKHIDETISFYIEQTDSDNYAVREAACACISEIAIKLNKDVVRPFLSRLLDSMIVCFNDNCWSVREMACLACGHLVAAFPIETQNYRQDALIPLFYNYVNDSHACARESGAFSLAIIIGAFDSKNTSYLKDIIIFILENLENIKNQTAESVALSDTAKHSINHCDMRSEIGQSDLKAITMDQQMCGLLVNKNEVKEFVRPSEPWEKADGSIFLIAELALHAKNSHEYMDELIQSLLKACHYKHYPHYVYLLSTACKAIADLCEGLGKPSFKRHLSDLLSIIDEAISCECKFTVAEAEKTIRFLSSKLGPNILKGRIEIERNELLSKVEHLFAA